MDPEVRNYDRNFKTPESPAEGQAVSAWNEFIRDAFEIPPKHYLETEQSDAATTQAELFAQNVRVVDKEKHPAIWAWRLTHPFSILTKPFDNFVTELDTSLRGRNLGPQEVRQMRRSIYGAIAVAGTAVDLADLPAQAANLGLGVGNLLTFGLETLSEGLAKDGVSWVLNKAGHTKGYKYVTPVSEVVAHIGNLIPGIQELSNPLAIESYIRREINKPFTGIVWEGAYNKLNKFLQPYEHTKETNPLAKHGENFFMKLAGHHIKKLFKKP